MTNLSYSEQREQIIQAAHMLFHAGVMSHSGHGNISVRLPEEGQMLLCRMAEHLKTAHTAGDAAELTERANEAKHQSDVIRRLVTTREPFLLERK